MCVCVLLAERQHAGRDAGEGEGGWAAEEEDPGAGADAAETGGRSQHGDPGPAGGGAGQAGAGEVTNTETSVVSTSTDIQHRVNICMNVDW